MLMATAPLADGSGTCLVVGLSRGNLDKLQDDRPIVFDLRAKLGKTNFAKICIFFAETEAEMKRQLIETGFLPPDAPDVWGVPNA